MGSVIKFLEKSSRNVTDGSVFPAELGEALRVLREEALVEELLMLAVVDLLQLLPSRVL